jgi:hypothetical protein
VDGKLVTEAAGRASLSTQVLLICATAALSLFNGTTFSPFFDSVAHNLYLATRGYPLFSPDVLFHLTPLAIAAMTLLLAGVPAAFYERVRGLQASTPGSLAVWLAATVLLTTPTIMAALAAD